MEKDCLRYISGKFEPPLNKLRGSTLDGWMPLSEIGSTVRRNLDDSTTLFRKIQTLYSPRIGLLSMDFRAREKFSSSCFLAVEAVEAVD